MHKTQYAHLVRRNLFAIERGETTAADVPERLDAISRQLHDHDGWVSWREIGAAVYEAAQATLAARIDRGGVWPEIATQVEEWRNARQ